MIINNVKIITMEDEDGIIDNGFVRIKDGKIAEIGSGCGKYEASEEQIDGEGGWLFPGFIDAHTHLGICEDSLGFEGDDTNEATDPISPQLRALDGINPFDRCFAEAREAGVTCVAVAPGSANPIGGQICVIKTAGRVVDKMLVKSPAAIKFALGENPKTEYHTKNQAPETRMSVAALIRESLYKARRYAEDKKRAAEDRLKDDEESEGIEEPDYDMKNEALIPLLEGKIPAHFHAHRADDIFTAVRLAEEFGLKYAIIHCTEGYLIADELGIKKARVFAGPNLCDRSKPELRSLSFKNPGILDKNGVCVTLTTDHPVTPIGYLPLCMALAVKEGMNPENALRAITINPARVLGVDDRVGSIKEGKDADLVLYSGDPTNIMNKPIKVLISGKVIE